MKHNIPEPLQVRLVQDSDNGVRYQLACNANATKNTLQLLTADSEPYIREKAQQRLAIEPDP